MQVKVSKLSKNTNANLLNITIILEILFQTIEFNVFFQEILKDRKICILKNVWVLSHYQKYA